MFIVSLRSPYMSWQGTHLFPDFFVDGMVGVDGDRNGSAWQKLVYLYCFELSITSVHRQLSRGGGVAGGEFCSVDRALGSVDRVGHLSCVMVGETDVYLSQP